MPQYPAYPKYKPTECEWCPAIPAHWDIDRAKWSITSCQNGVWGADPDGDDDLVCIRVADFDRQSLRVSTDKLTMRSIADKDRRNRLLNTGDLLLEKSGGGEQQLVGAVVEFNQPFPAVSSNFIARMVASDGISSRFLVYVHSHLYAGRVNYRSIKQTTGIQNLDSQAYLDEPIVYPPFDEQEAIARFLDFKTTQIDDLIAKKKTLLEKLAEKRSALISHAVTKGLDPSVPMKDSGVEWLGEIPESWKTTRIKFLGSLLLGLTYSPDDVVSDGGTLVLRSSNVQNGKLDLTDCVYVSCDIPQKIRTKLDDILICSRNGSRALIGKCALLTEEVAGQTFGAFMTVLRSRHTRFLYYVLNSTLFKFQSGRFLTSTINQLTTQTLGDFEIALPPEDVQEVIVSHLDTVTEAIDQQASKVQRVIDRLTEYRAALITNAVTGKIDVRDFQIPDPVAKELCDA